MNEFFFLYLLTRLNGVLFMAGATVLCFGVAFLFGFISWTTEYGQEYKDSILATVMNKSYILIMAILVIVLVPNQKEAAFIIAGTGVIEAARTDTAQRLAGKSVQVVEQYLDEILKEEPKK